jgi:Domain of unknown function (DUF4349)
MRRRDALPDPEVDHGLRELEAALAGEPTADPDLALLVADVRAAAPQPDAQFLATLDARVHAGFPRQEGAAAARRSGLLALLDQLRHPAVAAPMVVATLVAALIVVGISTSGGGNGGDSGGSASSVSARGETASGETASGETASGGQGAEETTPMAATLDSSSSSSSSSSKSAPTPGPSAPSSTPRKVERNAELTLTPAPDEVQDTADGVVRETQAAGGYVQTSSIRTRDDGGSASFTLRIPTAKLDDTLANLSKLAHVGALNQASTDITAQTASAADRLSDARAERRALLQALGRATTDRQIASLKARLRDNRSEIARRQGALDAQRRRADLATVSVEIDSAGQAAAPEDDGTWTPGDALHDAGRVLEVAGGVALIALAVLAPLGVLAALAALATRAVRRRRREAALDGAR